MSDPTVPPNLPPEFGVHFALLEVSALSPARRGRANFGVDGGLSFVQFQILALLGEDRSSPRSMTDLADRLVHSKSGLTYQVDQLEKAGLVTRVASMQDERGVNVTLSAKGASVLRARASRPPRGGARRARRCARRRGPCGAHASARPRRAAHAVAAASLRPPSAVRRCRAVKASSACRGPRGGRTCFRMPRHPGG